MCESSSLSLMPPSPSPPRLPGQPPEFKHFCRVCNKGFTCGSALGGHMRAHGASDVDGFGADDDSLGDEASAARCRGSDDQWDAVGTSSSATHAYALRANPNRLIRSCQVCKNCGKEFTSWELFLQHGKCNSEDEADEVGGGSGSLRSSSPPSDADGEEDPAVAAAWSKGKRSRRVKLMIGGEDHSSMASSRQETSGEEEDLANCLVMLSSSNVGQTTVVHTDKQERRASTAKEGDGSGPALQLQPISFFVPPPEPIVALPSAVAPPPQYITPSSRNVFECKACKKVFTSHQALGGHRASHKKVKGCFAAKFESNASEPTRHSALGDSNNITGKGAIVDEVNTGVNTEAKTSIYAATSDLDTKARTSEVAASLSMSLAPVGHNSPVAALTVAAPCKKNSKMHECSVCHRLFTSGQALGGHKRCHWLTSSTADPCNSVANMIPPLTEDIIGVVRHQLTLRQMVDAPEPALDLTIAANPAALAASVARPEAGSSSFHLEPLAPVHLQPLAVAVPSTGSHRKKTTATSSHHGADKVAEDDEADSTTAKRAKLSDLKDVVSMDGEPTGPWLQVGIGSSSAGGDDKSRESAIN
ncbi:hypothetical protein PAHAL_7G245600 [Panicum hallii]|uniref:C2H2-type domain-containing protein n=2 Tax=Panicum hallii TaxID=206008 RepID=A0A2S3I931_9POAL|nr:hypothetical protein PAHAL_7G245600 [Panicum hallii]